MGVIRKISTKNTLSTLLCLFFGKKFQKLLKNWGRLPFLVTGTLFTPLFNYTLYRICINTSYTLLQKNT